MMLLCKRCKSNTFLSKNKFNLHGKEKKSRKEVKNSQDFEENYKEDEAF